MARVRTAAAACCRSVDWGRWRDRQRQRCGRVRAILESGDHLKAPEGAAEQDTARVAKAVPLASWRIAEQPAFEIIDARVS